MPEDNAKSGNRTDANSVAITKGGKHHISWKDEINKGSLAEIKEVAQYKNGGGGCTCTVQ
jgi:hypothetical protein